MQVLSVQENKLINLLITMEDIGFDKTQITLNIGEDEYKIMLSREISDYDSTTEERKKSTTQVKIICEDKERLALERCYQHRYIKRGEGAGYNNEYVHYYGNEFLLNGEEVCIAGHAQDNTAIENEIALIEKQRKIKIDGNPTTIARRNSTDSDSDSLDIIIALDKDASNSFDSIEKSGNIIRLLINYCLSYLYDEKEKTYSLKKDGKIIALDEIENKLASVEEALLKINENGKKAIQLSQEIGMPTLVWNFSPIEEDQLNKIELQRDEISKVKKYIQTAIANNYFKDDFLWTSFNEEILEKINDAIVKRLADIETKNMEQKAENLLNSLSEEEVGYIKVLLKKQENSKTTQSE